MFHPLCRVYHLRSVRYKLEPKLLKLKYLSCQNRNVQKTMTASAKLYPKIDCLVAYRGSEQMTLPVPIYETSCMVQPQRIKTSLSKQLPCRTFHKRGKKKDVSHKYRQNLYQTHIKQTVFPENTKDLATAISPGNYTADKDIAKQTENGKKSCDHNKSHDLHHT